MKPQQLSDDAKNATIDRTDFDAVMKKLIGTKPITKEQISAKIKREGRASSSSVRRSDQR